MNLLSRTKKRDCFTVNKLKGIRLQSNKIIFINLQL